MEVETGKVVVIRGDKAVVQMVEGDLCSQCASAASCCAKGINTRQITIQNSIHAKEGDRVQISCHPKTRILSGFIIFILPVFMGFLGYFVGHSYFGSEGGGILGTFLGFVFAFIIIWAVNKILEKKNYTPTMLKIEA